MQKEVLDTILLEFKKLNERLNNIEKENENKFALIDARFTTLEGIVLSMQNDLSNLNDRITELTDRMNQFDVKLSELADRMNQFDVKLSELADRMNQFEERLSSIEKITLRMEYNFNDKISALFDAHTYQDDRYRNLDNRIRKIEIKVENLSVSNC